MSSDSYLPSTTVCRKSGDPHAATAPQVGLDGGALACDGECTPDSGNVCAQCPGCGVMRPLFGLRVRRSAEQWLCWGCTVAFDMGVLK